MLLQLPVLLVRLRYGALLRQLLQQLTPRRAPGVIRRSLHSMLRRSGGLCVMSLPLLVALASGPVDLLHLAEAPLGPGLPPGWKARAVRGVTGPDTDIRIDGGVPVFHLRGAGRAAWFYQEVPAGFKESDSAARLQWSWKVLEMPPGADLRTAELDDSPIRIYVVFGKPRRFFGGSGRVIFYSYGNGEPADFERASFASDKLHVIRVDGVSEAGRWQEHVVAPLEDFRRIWHRDPPPVTAIGIMQDTDQTRAMAVAEVRRLEWRTP